jgi:hypothetical protein
MTAGTSRELDYLRNRLADRMDEHTPEDWSPAFLVALLALFDLHFAEGGCLLNGPPGPQRADGRRAMVRKAFLELTEEVAGDIDQDVRS